MCLSRFSRTRFAFVEGLLVVVVVVVVVVVAAAIVVVVAAAAIVVVVAAAAVVVVVVAVVVVTVDVFKLVLVTVAEEVAVTATDFESLLADFRFLDQETSDVDVCTFAAGFSI
jgi:hypothetical protein